MKRSVCRKKNDRKSWFSETVHLAAADTFYTAGLSTGFFSSTLICSAYVFCHRTARSWSCWRSPTQTVNLRRSPCSTDLWWKIFTAADIKKRCSHGRSVVTDFCLSSFIEMTISEWTVTDSAAGPWDELCQTLVIVTKAVVYILKCACQYECCYLHSERSTS